MVEADLVLGYERAFRSPLLSMVCACVEFGVLAMRVVLSAITATEGVGVV